MSDLDKSFSRKFWPAIAFLGAALVLGVSAYSGFYASRSQNDASCGAEMEKASVALLAQDRNLPAASLLVLDAGDMRDPRDIVGKRQTFLLSGSLCTALNRAKYFKEERDKGAGAAREKSVALFFDDGNTHLLKSVPVANNDQHPDDWLLLNWKLRDPHRSESKSLAQAESDAWKDAVSGADFSSGRRTVVIGLGDKDAKSPGVVSNQVVELIVFFPWRAILGALGLLLVAAGLIASNLDTGLLRNGSGKIADEANPANVVPSSFSLSKAQMGLWTFLTIGGFLLLWVVMGRSGDIMNGEVLTLLGIQGTSGIAAVLIDSGKAKGEASGNFFRDILSDGVSVSFHRVQMLAWTLILAAIFVWSVFSTLTFPHFGTDLLLLSGIANGLYLGFKWPEGQSKNRQPGVASPPQSSGSAT